MVSDDLTQRIDAALDGTTREVLRAVGHSGPADDRHISTTVSMIDSDYTVTVKIESESGEDIAQWESLFALAPSLLAECRDALTAKDAEIAELLASLVELHPAHPAPCCVAGIAAPMTDPTIPQEAVEAAADAWVAYYDKVIETEGRIGDSARAADAALVAAAPILREQWEAEQDEWSNDLAELLDGFIEDSDDAQESLIEQAIRRLTADLAVARQQLDAVRAEVVEIWRHFQGIANYPPLIRDGGDGLRWAKLGRARCDALLAVAPTGDAPTTKDGGDLDCRHGCNGDCITSGSDDCNFTCHDTKDVSR